MNDRLTRIIKKRARADLVLITLLTSLVLTAGPAIVVRSDPGIIQVGPGEAYSRIQDAINAASPGDTILVSSGTYPENLLIAKSLNITATSRDNTIIDAQQNGPGINITGASSVAISGFTVRNTGFVYDGIIVTSSSTVMISSCFIQADRDTVGILLIDSNGIRMMENTITGNSLGISILRGSGNLVQKNNMTGNPVGISVSGSQGNQVKDNTLRGGATSLALTGSQGNVVSRNLIANNTGDGIFLQDSKDNWITENSIEFNRERSTSIGVRLQNSTGNRLYYNNIRNNTRQVFGVFPDDMSQNTWNDGTLSPKGNYWSDYSGLDNGIGGRPAGDGIGDTLLPHPCPNGGQPCSSFLSPGVDNNPLMTPYRINVLNVTASADRNSGVPPVQVAFNGSAVGGSPPYNWRWNFGTGDSSSNKDANYTYQSPGNYVAILTVTDDASNVRSDLVPITVFMPPQPDYTLFIVIGAMVAVGAAFASTVLFYGRRGRQRKVGPNLLGLGK